MKLLSLVTAIGLGIAFSVGAQEMPQQPQQQQQPTDEQQAPTKRGKTTVNQDTMVNQEPGPATGHAQRTQTSEKGKLKAQAGVSAKEGTTVRSTTVFRNGQQTSESLTLHQSIRERTDVHFSIGIHPRDWWLRIYSIVLISGCHYYLADNGCWYPAYGFDPSCDFPSGVVYCD